VKLGRSRIVVDDKEITAQAVPPSRNMSTAVSVASGWLVAAMPCRPAATLRPITGPPTQSVFGFIVPS